MRYRKLDSNGDMVLGFGQASLWINQPEAVAQAVGTRLLLYTGEWFLNTTDGMDWSGSVLGNRTQQIRDEVIKARILQTPGVNSILFFQTVFDGATRKLGVYVALDTIYGPYPVTTGSGLIGSGMPVPSSRLQPTTSLLFILDVSQLDSPSVLG